MFLIFGINGGPNPTPSSMNYTVVINMAVWGGSMLYYWIDARKWFTGPKITIEVEGLTEAQRNLFVAEGLRHLNVGNKDANGHSEAGDQTHTRRFTT